MKTRNVKKRINSFSVLIVFFVLGVLLVPSISNAALLELNPPTGSYVIGDTVSVDVFVNTNGESINAVSGEIKYDPGMLQAESVSHTNSIVDLWVQDPSVVNNNSVIFEGLILNPGFVGKGKVVTVNFTIVGEGIANVSFVSGLVLENDGFGTNILTNLSGATFSLLPGVSPRAVTGLPAAGEIEDGEEDTLVPAVISYTESPLRLSDLSIRGVTYPSSRVNVYLQPDGGDDVEHHVVVSDRGGNFLYNYGESMNKNSLATANVFLVLQSLAQPLTKDSYQFWLTAVHENVETDATQAFDVTVGGLITSLPGIIITLIVIALALVVYLLYSNRRRNKAVVKEMKKNIDNISYDIEKYEAKQRQDANEDNIDVK